jgi:hypothetical protein
MSKIIFTVGEMSNEAEKASLKLSKYLLRETLRAFFSHYELK